MVQESDTQRRDRAPDGEPEERGSILKRKITFGRNKGGESAVKAPTPSAPIRAPAVPRPRVEIDPRTGRPIGAPLTSADTRRTTSDDGPAGQALVDASRSSARKGRGSNDADAASGPKEARIHTDFQNRLVERKLVTNEQLDEAFTRHLRSNRHLFECLNDLGILDEGRVANEVSDFYQLPLCDLPHEELEPSALDLVPESVARQHMVFPVWLSPEGLFVAVAEPSERLAGLLVQASGQTVTMAIAHVSDIRWAIDSNYHALADVADLVQEFEFGEGAKKRAAPTASTTDQAADSAPIVQVVNRILSQAIRDGASDVHIEPSDDIVRVRNRVDGVLKVVLVLPSAMGLGLVSRIKIMGDMNIVERRRPQDGKFTTVVDGKEIDVRVATVATIWGETCVLRILDKTRSVLSIDDLGMTLETHMMYSKLIRSPFGMVLCVGPTGSGKTTTLYASLTEISDVARNVMTIEDPVEYVFPSINQIQTNEQAGLTFATGLKSILRQDSDIVLVGEIRDVETARIAVQSTLTGHFVLSSLHATDAISALTRFIDMGIESFLIASSVIAIVGQRLVRRLCSACKTPYTPSDEEMAYYERGGGPKKDVFFHGAGCNFCGHTGFKDRIGVYELFPMTQDMKRLIVGFATEDEIREMARKQGMRSIQDEAISLIAADLTTSAEVVRSIYSI
jgi:type IV pilus assembly protein PilB